MEVFSGKRKKTLKGVEEKKVTRKKEERRSLPRTDKGKDKGRNRQRLTQKG